jgi:ABC-type polysaccharide/polyol phosphate transport system ATPase subunit
MKLIQIQKGKVKVNVKVKVMVNLIQGMKAPSRGMALIYLEPLR